MKARGEEGRMGGCGFSLLEVVLGLGLLAGALAVLAGVLSHVEGLERVVEWESGGAGRAVAVAEQLEGSGEGAVVLVERRSDGALRLREFPGRGWLPGEVGEKAGIWSRRREERGAGLVRWVYEEESPGGDAAERLVIYEWPE